MIPVLFEAPTLEQLSEFLPAYEFEQLIAQGGMGAVYKARQRSLDREVAIKILPKELGSDPLFRESFASEAKAMARLSHSNLIRVYDYGDTDGLFYTVMEYVHGKSLYDSAYGKMIDPRQAIEIVLAASRGLAHAHDNGIVHRDIKPANILLNENCEPKIGDFGLARPTGHQSGGLVMGTPGYSAPEVLSHPEEGDRRSDIFAIGIILKEMLTGISANSEGFQLATVGDPRLAGICAKATAANPATRYPDIRSLCRSLESWQPTKFLTTPQGVPPRKSRPPAPPAPPARVSRVNWSLWKNCAVISFLLIAIHLTWNLYTRKQELVTGQAEIARENPVKPVVKSLQVEKLPKGDALAASSRF